MDQRETALYFFRKLVYLLYLEIGSLQPRVHPQIAAKARLNTAYFEREKERQALALYHEIEQVTDPAVILSPFVERTGLTLEDVARAFAEGDWRNRHGGFSSGGPRWARIAALTVGLRHAIDQADWAKVDGLLFEIKGLKTNQGYLVNHFERTERRRR